jgi:diguanylate cyclase (GGDEF)-like protein
MNGAAFIFAINVFVAGLLTLAFLALATADRGRPTARWFALSYASGLIYLAMEVAIAAAPSGRVAQVLVFASFLVPLVLFNIGLARKYSSAVPWRAIAAVLLASLAVAYAIQVMPRTSMIRSTLYQTPYFAMQIIGAGVILTARKKKVLDNLLAMLLLLSAVQFLAKPLLAQLLGGNGVTARDYHDTFYALVSQSLGTALALSIALLTLAIMVSDILVEAKEKSYTDQLSGLLNRRGFEARAQAVLHDTRRQGRTLSLVLCDLDHFKDVNDTYGHGAGDRTIAAFARLLDRPLTLDHVPGRIGGEEFAVALPGINLPAARLFAEGARNAFASMPIPGQRDDTRCTASFGVAEIQGSEVFEDLMRRADAALYEAKRNGRNQVRTAVPHSLDLGRASSA